MKSAVYFYFILFWFKNDIEAVEIENLDSSSTTTQKIPTQINHFENLTIQDILDSGIDENDRIEKKLLQAVIGFTSDIEAHSPIKLMGNVSFPRKPINIDLDSGYKAMLDNLVIVHGPQKRQYSTNVECDSFGNTTISIILPHDLKILSLLKVNHASKKSWIEGEIDVTLKGTRLYKTLATTSALDGSNLRTAISEIEYENAEMNIKVEKQLQKFIYSKWNTIMHQLENSVKETFEQDLNTLLSAHDFSSKSNSLVLFCSNKITTEQNKKKNAPPPHNNLKFNRPLYYVIPHKTSNIWKGAILSAGPIALEGLSNFNSLELKVSEDEHPPNSDDFRKDLRANLKTGELNGKFDWSWFMRKNNKNHSSVSLFSVEYFQLENEVSYATRRACYQNSLKVYLGEIKINHLEKLCENENLLIHSFLSEYLRTIITTHLKNNITPKINLNPSFSSCPGVSQWR